MDRRVMTAVAVTTIALGACGQKSEPVQDNIVIADNGSLSNVSSESASEENATSAMASENGAMTSQLSSGQMFANTVAASDAFEIVSSRLALTKATSKSVKNFAQRMIDAHTASTAKIKTAAKSANPPITPDPTLSPDQRQKMSALQSATGSAFDVAYIDDQIAAHQAALNLLRGYSSKGNVRSLQSVARELIPIVSAHLNSSQALKH